MHSSRRLCACPLPFGLHWPLRADNFCIWQRLLSSEGICWLWESLRQFKGGQEVELVLPELLLTTRKGRWWIRHPRILAKVSLNSHSLSEVSQQDWAPDVHGVTCLTFPPSHNASWHHFPNKLFVPKSMPQGLFGEEPNLWQPSCPGSQSTSVAWPLTKRVIFRNNLISQHLHILTLEMKMWVN